MSSELKTNKISPATGTALTLADSGDTLTLPSGATLSIASGATITNSGTATGFGGLTEADTWRLTTGFTGDALPITTNWERDDTYAFGVLGTGRSESSGIFSFPSTGYWLVQFHARCNIYGSDRLITPAIYVTTDNSTYNRATIPSIHIYPTSSGVTYSSTTSEKMLDVTDTANIKVQFGVDVGNSSTSTSGDTSQNTTYATFMKLGDT